MSIVDKALSILSSSNSLLFVIRLSKVHSFLDVSPRLMDVRGRNGFLIISRKLISLALQKMLIDHGCRAYILRCGGNLVYVVGECGDPCKVYSDLRPSLRRLVVLFNRLIWPASLHLEVYLCGSRLREYDHIVDNRSYDLSIEVSVEGKSITKELVCDACSRLEKGIPEEKVYENRFISHVARDERNICAQDLFYRFLGRTLNSPMIISMMIMNDISVGSRIPENDRDIVIGSFSVSNNIRGASLKYIAIRHPHDEKQENTRIPLDDVMVLTLRVKGKSDISISYLVIGVSSKRSVMDSIGIDYVKEISDSLKPLVSKYKDCSNREDKFTCIHDLFTSYSDTLDKHIVKILSSIKESIGFRQDRFMLVRQFIESILNMKPIGEVVPILWKSEIINPMIDYELTLLNLGGETGVLDLDTIASRSASLWIGFIRSDGDRFGTFTSISKLYGELGEAIYDLKRFVDNYMKSNGIQSLEELRNTPLEYIWDSIVEQNIHRVLRNTLALQMILSEKLLVIYVGGDENYFISPIIGDNPAHRIRSLLNIITRFRDLLLYVASRSLKEIGVRDPYEALVGILSEKKITTLSSAIILSSPKFPAYLITKLLDQGVELSKEAGRDATLIYTIGSVVMDYPSTYWLRIPIVGIIPNEYRGNMIVDLIKNAYLTYYHHPELIDVEKYVLDYCRRKNIDLIKCLDDIDEILESIYTLSRTYRSLDDLAKAIGILDVKRPYYASLETVRHIERGV